MNGAGVFAALEADAGCGLLERLIADDCHLSLTRTAAAAPLRPYT